MTEQEIDRLLASKETPTTIPSKEAILTQLKNHMAKHELKKVNLIANIFTPKKPYIVSALPPNKLLYHYLKQLGLMSFAILMMLIGIYFLIVYEDKNRTGQAKQASSHERPWLQK